jgi:DNA replication and repair protein RecF
VRLRSLIARGYRNLADLEREAPPRGVTLLGANAQGKTNLLEAIYYPVLFRSFRGAPDQQVVGNALGFHVEVRLDGAPARQVAVTYLGRKKRIGVDGSEMARVADVIGTWVGVAFLPSDLGLATGAAAVRRQYLDRLLSLSSRQYLRALTQYRGALAQRNSALRQGRADVARAFDAPLAVGGAELIAARLKWSSGASEQFAAEFDCLGEAGEARLSYLGRPELAEAAAWDAALSAAIASDRERGMTTVGPHRDDLVLEIGGRALRDYGSTGQQRSAAVALKLIEIAGLRQAHGTEPVLLLDDVFAELDRERQSRLARRLMGPDDRQVFVTSPRLDELPPNLDLPVWTIEGGSIL